LELFEGVDDGGEVLGEERLIDLAVEGEGDTVLDGDLSQLIHNKYIGGGYRMVNSRVFTL
jgi:hypothetical protein